MINEYLFLTDEHRREVSKYKPDGVTVEISDISNTTLWIAAYSAPNKNQDSAGKLSDVHSFLSQYSPLTLSCESSEYYNKALYPLVNKFERKLRKALYLSASISNSGEAQKTINELETKTLGYIFNSLFFDHEFIKGVKKRVNGKDEFNGRGNYSKAEISDYLSALEENTLWDKLFPGCALFTIKSRFQDILECRNKVMHAHNIDKATFGKIRYLCNKANNELDAEVKRRIGQVEEKPEEVKRDVNTSISSALDAIKESQRIELARAIKEMQNMVIIDFPMFSLESEIQNMVQNMVKIDLPMFSLGNEIQNMAKNMVKIDLSMFGLESEIQNMVQNMVKIDLPMFSLESEIQNMVQNMVQNTVQNAMKPLIDAQNQRPPLIAELQKRDLPNLALDHENENNDADIPEQEEKSEE